MWLLGSEVKSTLTLYFPWFRKIVGPILIIIGLFMLGIIKFRKTVTLGSIPNRLMKSGKLGVVMDILNPLTVRLWGANINRETTNNIESTGLRIESDSRLMGSIFRELAVHPSKDENS